MYFVDANSLGEDFFQHTPRTRGEEERYSMRNVLDEFDLTFETRYPDLRAFARWVITSVIPEYNAANPDRPIPPYSTDNQYYRHRESNANLDIHVDSSLVLRAPYPNRTFVTIGVGIGEVSGTLFPKDESKYPVTSDVGNLTTEALKQDFYSAPYGWAAVFDPDHDLHAGAPGEERILYKAALFTGASYGDFYVPIQSPEVA